MSKQQFPATKRRRAGSEALTPPVTVDDPEGASLLSCAVHVLSTAATALSQVTILYQSDPIAREGLVRAVEYIRNIKEAGGKLLICGVGKSGLVGKKTVASMKSLGIPCTFLHPTEALHGDLGDIRPVSNMDYFLLHLFANSFIVERCHHVHFLLGQDH